MLGRGSNTVFPTVTLCTFEEGCGECSALNLITAQQDATVFSLLHFCRQRYTFQVLTPIIRS